MVHALMFRKHLVKFFLPPSHGFSLLRVLVDVLVETLPIEYLDFSVFSYI